MATDGINRLISVTQMKSQNANDEAMAGADRQRDLINRQKEIRGMQRRIDTLQRSEGGLTGPELEEIRRMMGALNLDQTALNGIKTGWDDTKKLNIAYSKADGNDHEKANQSNLDAVKASFGDVLKDLESADKLGSFEINDLMSNYNQAETLASSVRKKLDDTLSGQINKI